MEWLQVLIPPAANVVSVGKTGRSNFRGIAKIYHAVLNLSWNRITNKIAKFLEGLGSRAIIKIKGFLTLGSMVTSVCLLSYYFSICILPEVKNTCSF